MFETTLNRIIDIGSATINNLYSPTFKKEVGSTNRARKDIRRALNNTRLGRRGEKISDPYVVALNSRLAYSPTHEVFYAVTKAGCKYLGREDDFKPYYTNSQPNVKHDSGVRDLMLSCMNFWPDDKVYYKWLEASGEKKYHRTGIETDFKQGNIIWENERKNNPSGTYLYKLKAKYEHYDLPKGTKVAIVWSDMIFNPFLRSQTIEEFKSKESWTFNHENDERLSEVQKLRLPISAAEKGKLIASRAWIKNFNAYKESLRLFDVMMEGIKKRNLKHDYYFTHFSNFYLLDKPVWEDKKRNKCKLR